MTRGAVDATERVAVALALAVARGVPAIVEVGAPVTGVTGERVEIEGSAEAVGKPDATDEGVGATDGTDALIVGAGLVTLAEARGVDGAESVALAVADDAAVDAAVTVGDAAAPVMEVADSATGTGCAPIGVWLPSSPKTAPTKASAVPAT